MRPLCVRTATATPPQFCHCSKKDYLCRKIVILSMNKQTLEIIIKIATAILTIIAGALGGSASAHVCRLLAII